MKKISETTIGTRIMKLDSYVNYGNKTLFAARTVLPTKYHSYGISQAYCTLCDSLFTSGNNYTYYSQGKITCPGCGHTHQGNAICYTEQSNSLMPAQMKLTVIEFKDKIELRLSYTANCIGKRLIYNDIKTDFKANETFTFDIKNETVLWKQTAKALNIDRQEEIGFFDQDFNVSHLTENSVMNKSALQFYAIDHMVHSGDTLTSLLRKLRNAIVKKMVQKGYTKKNIYVSGDHKHILLGNILNYAHRVRFWDFNNLPKMNQNLIEYLSEGYSLQQMPKNWLRDIDRAKKDSHATLMNALIQYFKLPNCKTVRANITNLNKIYNLTLAFGRIKDLNQAESLFEYFEAEDEEQRSKMKRREYYNSNPDLKENVLYFTENIYPSYHQCSFIKTIMADNMLPDIVRLFKRLDPDTMTKFRANPPKFKDLHDWLSYEIAKQKDQEKIFDIPDYIKARFDMQINNYAMSIVPKYSELQKLALKLKNCAAGYRDSINASEQVVAVTDDKGKIIAALEIQNGRLEQAKLYANDQVKNNKLLNNIILEYAEKSGLIISTDDIEQEEPQIA